MEHHSSTSPASRDTIKFQHPIRPCTMYACNKYRHSKPFPPLCMIYNTKYSTHLYPRSKKTKVKLISFIIIQSLQMPSRVVNNLSTFDLGGGGGCLTCACGANHCNLVTSLLPCPAYWCCPALAFSHYSSLQHRTAPLSKHPSKSSSCRCHAMHEQHIHLPPPPPSR